MTTSMIRDSKLAPGGHDKINWVKNFMPVLSLLDKDLSKEAILLLSCKWDFFIWV